MKEQYINIRVESVSTEKNKELIKHCLRLKKEKRAINDTDNSYIDMSDNTKILFNRIVENNTQNETVGNIGKQLLNHNNNIVEKQKSILKQNGKYLNSKRTNSILSGVITFSDSIKDFNDAQLNELEVAAQRCVNEICDKYNTEAHYIVFHKDEEGLPHFHFSVDNFDNESGLNFSKSKNFGSDLQDIAGKHFSRFGFNRGIKRENNFNRKHLSIEEYKQYQDTQKELIKAKEELKHTKALNSELKADNEQLLIKLGAIENEFMTLIDDFEDFILTERDKDKLIKIKELFKRYSKNENAERMLSTLEKTRKQLKRVKKTSTIKNPQ